MILKNYRYIVIKINVILKNNYNFKSKFINDYNLEIIMKLSLTVLVCEIAVQNIESL